MHQLERRHAGIQLSEMAKLTGQLANVARRHCSLWRSLIGSSDMVSSIDIFLCFYVCLTQSEIICEKNENSNISCLLLDVCRHATLLQWGANNRNTFCLLDVATPSWVVWLAANNISIFEETKVPRLFFHLCEHDSSRWKVSSNCSWIAWHYVRSVLYLTSNQHCFFGCLIMYRWFNMTNTIINVAVHFIVCNSLSDYWLTVYWLKLIFHALWGEIQFVACEFCFEICTLLILAMNTRRSPYAIYTY